MAQSQATRSTSLFFWDGAAAAVDRYLVACLGNGAGCASVEDCSDESDSFVIVGDVWRRTHMHVDMDVMARCYGDGSSFYQHEVFVSIHIAASVHGGSICY